MCRLARRVPLPGIPRLVASAATLATAASIALVAAPVGAKARDAAALAGPWQLSTTKAAASCRVQLQAARSDSGEFFFGMPPACRHAMPEIAAAGRWAVPDDAHLVLAAPGGKALLTLTAAGSGWIAIGPAGTYTLTPAAAQTDALAAEAAAAEPAPERVASPAAPLAKIEQVSTHIERVSTHGAAASRESAKTPEEVTGRYAVMREKHDTGCMLTLDRSHGKSGDRAQLAPGCRDQGIVIFDPAGWQLVHGELVLTARAGHKTKLDPAGEGVWSKNPKEGGKPLGLKKL